MSRSIQYFKVIVVLLLLCFCVGTTFVQADSEVDPSANAGGTGGTGGSGGTGGTNGSGGTGGTNGSGGTGGVSNCPPDCGPVGTIRTGNLNNPSIQLFNPLGNKSIGDIFLAILDIIMVFAVPIILFFIVWAGFLYVTAQGSQTQLEKATRAFTYAIIGGLLVLGAQALLYVITNTIRLFS